MAPPPHARRRPCLPAALFTWSYFDNRNAITAQAGQFEALQAPLTTAGENPPSVEQPAIDVALGAMDEVAIARTAPPDAVQDLLGPSASAELVRAQADTYDHALRNVLEPHMVALLEATMWRQIRDPDFMLGALKTYRMMTGLSQMDADFAQNWWVNSLPEFAPAPPFPTTDAEEHQLAAIRRMAVDDNYIAPDKALVAEALKTVCTISLPQRAYKQLLADPEVAAVKEWIPANFAGPNGAKVFARRSDKTLRVGISGAFTYAGFHDAILDRVEDVAGQAALDRAVFAGGCSENSETSVSALSEDILKLYYDDYIAQWDSFLRDMRLAPLSDLNVASENLKDLSSADSALKRLLTAVVQETELTRSDEAPAGDDKAAAKGGSKLLGKLGKLGKIVKTGAKLLAARRLRRSSRPDRQPGGRTLQAAQGRDRRGRRPAAGARRRRCGADGTLQRAADGHRQSRSAGRHQETGRARRTDRRGRQAGADPARSDRRLAGRHRRRHQRPDAEGGHLGAQRHLAR